MKPYFFFGSLRDRALLEIVLDRPVAEQDIATARAQGFATRCVVNEQYPVLNPVEGHSADGVVVQNLTTEDVARLEYFEETEYGLGDITVDTASGPVDAVYFRATGKVGELETPWDYDVWWREDRAVAHEAARELMAHRGIIPPEDIETIWTGIMLRARMRVRAAAETPVTGRIRSAYGPEDVDSVAVMRPYTLYFAIEDHHLRHRRFDGTMSDVIQRAVITSGDAVTVVPFDPRRERVMLIEQFRTPLYARGDANPWIIEAIAGRIDIDGTAEGAARREAEEEGGVALGRLEIASSYYPTPGFAAEHLTSFVGEADLSDAGGTFGLAHEAEDIRAFTLPLDEALEGVASGEINAGPAVLTLLWLQIHRERLCSLWT